MIAVDAAAGADVVAHLFQPGELVGCEGGPGDALFFKPARETLPNVFFERFKLLVRLQCELAKLSP